MNYYLHYLLHPIQNPTYGYTVNLKKITGLDHFIYPDEGRSSVTAVKIYLQDRNDVMTRTIGNDDYYFHNKKCTVKEDNKSLI